MMRRFGLRDDQWERIKDLLPGREDSVGVTAADNRLFVEAVLYRYRAGIPWRDLPERFGDWKNVHRRFSRWSKSGIWEKVFKHLAADAVRGAKVWAWTCRAVRLTSDRRGPPEQSYVRLSHLIHGMD